MQDAVSRGPRQLGVVVAAIIPLSHGAKRLGAARSRHEAFVNWLICACIYVACTVCIHCIHCSYHPPPKCLQAQHWMGNFPRDAVCAAARRTPGTAVRGGATSSPELYLGLSGARAARSG